MTVLFELLPALSGRVPWIALADLPTPIDAGGAVVQAANLPGELWLKRDDRSSSIYGGSKLRLLEHLLAEARQGGADQVYSTGAVGSNFAIATALHADRVGLEPGAICFPQAMTPEAERSHRALLARAQVIEVAHWSLLPMAAQRVRRRAQREGRKAVVLSQARFSARALLGYLAAGLELAQQVKGRVCPAPARIVLPIGSAATSAGVLAGLSLARKIGLWNGPPALLEAVRIAAWPLSRRARVLALSRKVLAFVAEMCGSASLGLAESELFPLTVVTDQLGAGYPHPSPAGTRARQVFEQAGVPILDGTYSAKAAAHALRLLEQPSTGPVLFWCTKSSAPLDA
ncbi:MAG TPA: pyridoxal-phosphate dependent enzyme [Polyangiaceae bacterium]|nr:pyridoxal-phosphate dependent enzyme [Polyangiaceae bacterium]